MSYNEITGDKLVSKALSKEGREQFNKIFPPKEKVQWEPPPLPPEVIAELEALKAKQEKKS